MNLNAILFKIIQSIRFQWNSSFINLKKNELNETVLSLDCYLPAGWYMIEMAFASTTSRVDCIIECHSKNTLINVVPLKFPVDICRITKRLVILPSGGHLTIRYSENFELLELNHFNLKRVTKFFAYSRILKKLKVLHPLYKKRGVVSKYPTRVELEVLWLDYCAVFDESSVTVPYPLWISNFDNKNKNRVSDFIKLSKNYWDEVRISVIMPVYNPNPTWLLAAISSVQSQSYENWELCIADDASTDPQIKKILEEKSTQDKRIKVIFRKDNGHISIASNSALRLVSSEWIALLDHDDVLPEHALFWVAEAINRNPNCKIIYSDEDKIDSAGNRSDPYFKSGWNTDLFYSQNMFSHLGVYNTQLVRDIGGFRVGLEGSQDYDLALRCIAKIDENQIHHIPRILYHWRIHSQSTALNLDAKPYAMIAGQRALNDHFQRIGIEASAEFVGYGYRVSYSLPTPLPLVSLIIPTRNKTNLLRKCVDSIFHRTEYNSIELIIIDNNSDDLDAIRYLKKLSSNPRIRVISDTRPFNYSELNNAAVKLANGEIIGLMNNDVEVINSGWLSEMVSHALRPSIAAVGARLWYSDDTLQHAGMVLGINGLAGHVHRYLPSGNGGYCGRASLIQSFSAVTAACLVVRKSIYEELGGLNETELQVACNDVDFCLRAREAGYKNIWTPYAELYHHESASRGFDDTPEKQARSAKEVAYMKQRWGDALLNDPAYSPNLTLDSEDFGLAWPPRVPSLDEVLSAMEQADQASTLSPPPALQ